MKLLALELPALVTVVRVLGVILGLLGVVLCLRLLRLKQADLTSARVVKLGFVALPAVAFYKLLAFLGLFAVPVAAVGVANYHVFEGTREVNSCNQCHVMTPLVTDMRDPHSNTLAARHFRNHWIPEQQCYHCHTDYGLNGTLEAKMDGYRHLARYTTGTYKEPIVQRNVYSNSNCLKCHDGTPRYLTVSSHRTLAERLQGNEVSCLNCHGWAHPTRAQRTPGSPDYNRLMGKEKR